MIIRTLIYMRRHAIAATALGVAVLAMASASYAAFSLPAQSVGARELQDHSIGPIKFDPTHIGGFVWGWAYVAQDGHVLAGSNGAQRWRPGWPGDCQFCPPSPKHGRYAVVWRSQLPSHDPCETIVNVPATGAQDGDGIAAGLTSPGGFSKAATLVDTYNLRGQPTPENFYVLVVC